MHEQAMELHTRWPIGASIKEIVVEASRALTSLDASRLEEIALACQALTRKQESDGLEPQEADQEMRRELMFLGRMLDVTRTNMGVLRRSEERRTEYNAASGRE